MSFWERMKWRMERVTCRTAIPSEAFTSSMGRILIEWSWNTLRRSVTPCLINARTGWCVFTIVEKKKMLDGSTSCFPSGERSMWRRKTCWKVRRSNVDEHSPSPRHVNADSAALIWWKCSEGTKAIIQITRFYFGGCLFMHVQWFDDFDNHASTRFRQLSRNYGCKEEEIILMRRWEVFSWIWAIQRPDTTTNTYGERKWDDDSRKISGPFGTRKCTVDLWHASLTLD